MLTSKRAFFDMDGKHLFDLKKEHFHLHDYMKMVTEDGEKFCDIKKHYKGMHPFHTLLDCTP